MPVRSGWMMLIAASTVAAGACSRPKPDHADRRAIAWIRLNASVYEEPLWVGEAPQPVSVLAFDSAGHAMRVFHATATARIRDDSIARIIGSKLYALSRGETRMDIELAGAHGVATIKVAERAVHDSVTLVGGQLRTWRFTPGYYEMRLVGSAGRDSADLELAPYNANCADAPRHDGQHYFCILNSASALVVRNLRRSGAHSERSGRLTVFRLP